MLRNVVQESIIRSDSNSAHLSGKQPTVSLHKLYRLLLSSNFLLLEKLSDI